MNKTKRKSNKLLKKQKKKQQKIDPELRNFAKKHFYNLTFFVVHETTNNYKEKFD
ncbi:hypothetical protein DOY81_008055 [Sarcophaga bullata]|nr:hypothetical protein DOY81_008055 [Sarcophaga bullata]